VAWRCVAWLGDRLSSSLLRRTAVYANSARTPMRQDDDDPNNGGGDEQEVATKDGRP
jgi:hypothetical protein